MKPTLRPKLDLGDTPIGRRYRGTHHTTIIGWKCIKAKPIKGLIWECTFLCPDNDKVTWTAPVSFPKEFK